MKAISTCLVLASLAACGRPDAVAEEANNVEALPPLNVPAPSPTGAAPANAVATNGSAPVSGGAIPAVLQGRWGLTPADCTSTRGDAKGLLVVDVGRLQFYESRAVPSPGIQTTDTSLSGNFAFTGEGQEWTKYETLKLRDGKLVRTERDPMASFTYVRC